VIFFWRRVMLDRSDLGELHSGLSNLLQSATVFVLCDESGHTKFPFSYLAHVMLLTPAQGQLRAGSGCSLSWITG
jgi:hypothetical protein